LKGRAEFASTTPDMLKYQPKRFWGLICKNKNVNVGVSAQKFAEFNQKLFFDEEIPGDEF
jgi:hypothetical protein